MLVTIITAFTLIAFAANSLLCRVALDSRLIDPVSFTTVRLVSGALALILISRTVAESTASDMSNKTEGSWGSGLALFVYAITFSLAYISLDTGMGALILFGAVQVTMIGAALKSGEYLGPSQWLGTGLAIGGLIYLLSPGLSAPDPLGVLLMCSAGVSWGIYSVRGRGILTPIAATARNFARSAPLAVIASIVAFSFVRLETSGILLALISGIVTSGLGYILWYKALRSLTTTQASVIQLLVPILAALGGIAFLAEKVTGRLFISGFLIIGGVFLAVIKHRSEPA